MKRGYFGIAVENYKHDVNIGTLLRSAQCFGAAFVVVIGKPYNKAQASDTTKAFRHMPVFNCSDIEAFRNGIRPMACQIISVETEDAVKLRSVALPRVVHPERAIYLLGSESGGLTQAAIDLAYGPQGYGNIHIPTQTCLNLAVAGSLVMYDRAAKELVTGQFFQ